MSETVLERGKLKKIETPAGLTKMEKAQYLVEELGMQFEDYNLEYGEADDEKILYLNGSWYEVIEYKQSDAYDISEVVDNGDGTLDFLVMYYNGGCGIGEAIESGMS